jgi:hypothetical protein
LIRALLFLLSLDKEKGRHDEERASTQAERECNAGKDNTCCGQTLLIW